MATGARAGVSAHVALSRRRGWPLRDALLEAVEGSRDAPDRDSTALTRSLARRLEAARPRFPRTPSKLRAAGDAKSNLLEGRLTRLACLAFWAHAMNPILRNHKLLAAPQFAGLEKIFLPDIVVKI
jgi:hypothetical protein